MKKTVTTIATNNNEYILLYVNNKFCGKCRKEDVDIIVDIITNNHLNIEVKTRGARQ